MDARWVALLSLLVLVACRSQADADPSNIAPTKASSAVPSAAPAAATSPRPPTQRTTLRLATYNVLEVAEWMLPSIATSTWVTANYHLTQRSGRPFSPGGQLLLSKYPITNVRAEVLPGRQGRTVVVADEAIPTSITLYPSDHYGVLATMAR